MGIRLPGCIDLRDGGIILIGGNRVEENPNGCIGKELTTRKDESQNEQIDATFDKKSRRILRLLSKQLSGYSDLRDEGIILIGGNRVEENPNGCIFISQKNKHNA